jgi:mannose-6-phosphate isomerase
MERPYPLLLKPVFKSYLWGGDRLNKEFGFHSGNPITAEAWMLACHKDGSNVVANGALAGQMLPDVLQKWGYEEPPILIKLIDAKQKLSVQVHPDQEYARLHEGDNGKTEMWYVVDCAKGAELIYGFQKKVNRAEFEKRIKDNTLDEITNHVPVQKGDVFFIEAGTLHAIGEGILIAEIQQSSNVTYRVSDYGRLDANGKPRTLHIEKALDVTVTDVPSHPYGKIGAVTKHAHGSERTLCECELFKVTLIDLNGEKCAKTDTVSALLVLDGQIELQYDDGKITLHKGDSVLIPKSCETLLQGKGQILYTIA